MNTKIMDVADAYLEQFCCDSKWFNNYFLEDLLTDTFVYYWNATSCNTWYVDIYRRCMYIESEFWIIGIFQITCDSNLVESETVRQGGRGQTQGHNQDREGGSII
jgi:hypothetical protein